MMCTLERKTILVTGGNGFIGQALIRVLIDNTYNVVGMCRKVPKEIDTHYGSKHFRYDLYTDNDTLSTAFWECQLKGVDTVIHLAGRVHVMKERGLDAETEFRRINTEFTKALTLGALKSGVKKFVYLSTIGVHGSYSRESTISETSPILLDSYYSESKFNAERAIRNTCDSTAMSFVILRPPLVYGAKAKGNYLRLLKWASSGIPFVFEKISNARSFINIHNLTNIVLNCVSRIEANNQVFVVSDMNDISTNQLCQKICMSLDKRYISLRVPLGLLTLIAKLTGKTKAIDSLVGDYKIDVSKLMKTIAWFPPYTLDDGIKEAGEWFKSL